MYLTATARSLPAWIWTIRHFLGDTVEQVGFEKPECSVVANQLCGGQNPAPESLVKHAEEIGAKLLMVQRDFDFASMESVQWNYRFHPQSSDGQTVTAFLAVSCFARCLSVVQCRVCIDGVGVFERTIAG